MESVMLKRKSLERSDESQNPPNARIDLVKMGDQTVARYVFQPGWQWSKDVKPIAGTNSCQKHHFGVYASGKMHVKLDDGTEYDTGAGDVVDIPPGHDGWVVGNEPVVYYEFTCKTCS